ncbi:MAG: hypothetical protein JNM18_18935 [Planctomycetaceae bacterium]|nr:hypothetical protein [Planctomycetaceae bacterium]
MGENPDINPYAAPETPVVPFVVPSQISDAESIRRKFLNHEMNIKSCGTLYLLGGILLMVSMFFLLVGFISRTNSGLGPGEMIAFLPLLGMVGLALAVGWGLQKLRPWVKVPAAILAVLNLLNIPIGTLLGVAVLYFVFSAKGTYCFSPEYQEIIRQTPHVKLKTSWLAWLALGLIVIILIAALMGIAVRG